MPLICKYLEVAFFAKRRILSIVQQRRIFSLAMKSLTRASASLLSVPGFLLLAILVGPLFLIISSAQDQPKQSSTPQTEAAPVAEKTAPEVTSHDEATTFKVNVRLVLLRVVVRDAQGHAVGNLQREDFQLLDNKKPQLITQFSIEQPGSQVAKEQKTQIPTAEAPKTNAPPEIPERFVAYVFDDVHLETKDLMAVRDAADKYLNSLRPTDRACIITTSGQGNLDFTDDHAKLHEALLRLQPRPVMGTTNSCPHMTYYMADMIVNKNMPDVLLVAAKDAFHCTTTLDPESPSGAPIFLAHIDEYRQMAQSFAYGALSTGEQESRLALDALKNAMRRLAAAPGQRLAVLVSPGFLTPLLEYDVSDVIDKALHAGVVVGTLDARGLYVPQVGGDISGENAPDMMGAPEEAVYDIDAASQNDMVLGQLADATGGVFFHNNNDLLNGFRETSAAPEYYYVLGFAPQNLKYDGRFHTLSVKLAHPAKLTIQARKGYFAPKQAPNANEEAKQEIEEALFSQEEMHDLPVQLHTQFFKANDLDAKLSVLVHVDVKRLHYVKAEGRNNKDLTIAAALFDHNGSFIKGNEKIFEMHLKDDTLDRKVDNGVTLKTSFDVKPGSYLVRLVVRDNEGLLSAENGAIEIP